MAIAQKVDVRFLVVVFLAIGMSVFLEAELVRDYKLLQKEERLQGKKFVHRRESDISKNVEAWVVEGAVVSKEQFEELYLEASKEELRVERAREQAIAEEEASMKRYFRRSILQKLVKGLVEDCRAQIALIERNGLDSYMVFSATTIKDSATYVDLAKKRLDAAMLLIEQADVDAEILEKEEQELSDSCSRLKAFVRATIDRAIEQCTDTKLLKKLLNDIV